MKTMEFKKAKLNDIFTCCGTIYTKQSTRTARLTDPRFSTVKWFYFRLDTPIVVLSEPVLFKLLS